MESRGASGWKELYTRTPLCDVPAHFANIGRSPYLLEYLTEVLRRCPEGGRTLETGIGHGFGPIWLSKRGIHAEGTDNVPGIIERARQINNILGGAARFSVGDAFHLYAPGAPRYDVVHHQGVLEHFAVPWVRAILAQQTALANAVVFSVPSVYYAFEPEFGDERLLPIEEWEHLLAPFEIEELRYYGDQRLGGREHILGVLRGQQLTNGLLEMMSVPDEPYAEGLSLIVHTRNEEARIRACLEALGELSDGPHEIIVCDMESGDRTIEIGLEFGAIIVNHPLIANFDQARNVSAMRARYRHVLYLDADEIVQPGFIPALRRMIAEGGDQFEAALVPFHHVFVGRPLTFLYPGYTAPRLLRNGKFVFRPRLHSGASVDGRTIAFPAENPALALVHHSYDNLSHYLQKLDRYTEGESANMHRDGQAFHWQRAIEHFVGDLRGYYDNAGARRDGVHGFLYSFLSGFYRFEQHAKLYERRFRAGQVQPGEEAVPESVEQLLEFALAVVQARPKPAAAPISVAADGAAVVWSGPLHDPSGYGEECRNFLFALEDAGVDIAGHSYPWSDQSAPLAEGDTERLQRICSRAAGPGFVQIAQDFPFRVQRHSAAAKLVIRTMFETDRLPGELGGPGSDWAECCNRADLVLVPSEFNRRTFIDSGVTPDRIAIVPGCLDAAEFAELPGPTELTRSVREDAEFLLLSVFDWTLHKGWDVLLRTFLETFDARSGARLALRVWSTMGYSSGEILRQAQERVGDAMGVVIAQDDRLRFLFDRLARPNLLALYAVCDAFVLASRGEGWGRPYMEAMAAGKAVIGTNWSGSTAFMTAENSFLVDYRLEAVPEDAWREAPTFRGHRWADPDQGSLAARIRAVAQDPAEAARRGAAARQFVLENFNRQRVGRILADAIGTLEPRSAATNSAAPIPEASDPSTSSPALATVPGIGRVEDDIREPTVRPAPGAKSGRTKRVRAGAGTDRITVSESDLSRTVRPPVVAPPAVRLEGALFAWHSLAGVNRALASGLMERGVEVSFVPNEPSHFDAMRFPEMRAIAGRTFMPLSRLADVHIRHHFPPRFERPDEGRLVLIQPWEYGYLPKAWIDPIGANVAEVWCYSDYVRRVYLASGIPDEMLRVIPLGVDADVFRPGAPPWQVPGPRPPGSGDSGAGRFTFLFVGGTLQRKGIDILLEAYTRAFSAYDDVLLVVKDTGTRTVYKGQNERERILALAADPTRPEIVYIEEDLTPHQLAGIYTASDCVVLPYRGEGFNLPALEALACGVPVIVTEGGPTDDFVDETVGRRVRAERKPFGEGRIGPWECCGPTWMFEVDPRELGRVMREFFQDRDGARKRGAAGRERVVAGWTWAHTCERALARIAALRGSERPAERGSVGLPDGRHGALPGGPPEGTDRNTTVRVPGSDRRASAKRRDSAANAAQPGNRQSPTATRMFLRAPRISLAMIAKDEERVLDACLTSVREFVDEIVFVDTGSSDRTPEIAASYGAKVIHDAWIDNFSHSRNVSLANCTGDWAFWMDCDDSIPEESGRALRDLILRAESDVGGFILQVRIPADPADPNAYGETVVDHVKVFRLDPRIRFQFRIHEQILQSIYDAGYRIERSDLFVVHSGYDYSPAGQARKRERDLRIIALDIEENPSSPFPRFNMGMTRHHLKQFDLAIESLETALSLSKPHESTVRKIYSLLTSCHLEQNDMVRARTRVDDGLALTPRDPELLFRAGSVYHRLGDLPKAERFYRLLLSEPERGHIDSIDVTITGCKANHNLAMVYQDMGRLDDAEAHWKAAIAADPQFGPALAGLEEFLRRLRR